jgi:hypothetical protein
LTSLFSSSTTTHTIPQGWTLDERASRVKDDLLRQGLGNDEKPLTKGQFSSLKEENEKKNALEYLRKR